MKYLNNNICEFKPLFNYSVQEKKNIVSCSFFKLHASQYKDFNLYINGLEKLYDKVYNQYKNEKFIIRLFIDNSIYKDQKLYERLQKMNKLEIILYSCTKYQIGTNLNYHVGLFGTLVRFFPLFNFENNDADIIIISDIDNYDYFEKSIKNIKLIKSNIKSYSDLSFFKAGNISKNVLFTISSLYKGVPNPYAVASNFISFSKCDYKVLYNFLIEISESNELLTKYQYKLEENANLFTDDKFVYGFDEYFLNINYTNYLIDTSKTICVKFKWSVYGCLNWYFFNKNIPQYQIDLIDDMFKYIYNNIGYKYIKEDNIINKFKTLKKNINKNNSLSQRILFEFYSFFISVENDNRYRFLFKKDIYTLIKKYNLFGIYDFEIITFASNNSEYFNFVKKKIFEQNKINKLKNIKSKSSLSRINLTSKIPINSIECNIKFINNLSFDKNRWVDTFNLNGKDIVLKKEKYKQNNNKENYISQEYNFFIKYTNFILKDNFDKFILLPIDDIKNCSDDNKNEKWYIYIFDKLNCDYNDEYIKKNNFKQWLKYTIEICLIAYYLNNILGIYHNDLCYKNNFRNIMIKKNTSKTKMIVSNYELEINEDYPVFIDFGQQSPEPKLRTYKFYNSKYKKRTGIKFISEVFIMYYYSFKLYFKFDDYWDEKYYDLYFTIQSKSSSLKEFDSHILNNLFELYEKN
jgi:hypothetical protein